MSQLTHINAAGEAHMVDVSGKAETVREATPEGERWVDARDSDRKAAERW